VFGKAPDEIEFGVLLPQSTKSGGNNFNYFPESLISIFKQNKKSPANAKGNAQQRCTCEGPVRTKSNKLTTMFHLNSTADDA